MCQSPTNTMECSVCYSEAGPFRKLCCGHEFCSGCIKTWYQKGSGTGCPMCRRAIYFRGFHKLRDEWAEEQHENKCTDVIDQYRTELINDAFEFAAEFRSPGFRKVILGGLMEDLRDLESTTRCLKEWGADSDYIEYILYDTDEYYSDRRIDKCAWEDAPTSPFQTRYPKVQKSNARGERRRSRAREDQWFTLSLTFLV